MKSSSPRSSSCLLLAPALTVGAAASQVPTMNVLHNLVRPYGDDTERQVRRAASSAPSHSNDKSPFNDDSNPVWSYSLRFAADSRCSARLNKSLNPKRYLCSPHTPRHRRCSKSNTQAPLPSARCKAANRPEVQKRCQPSPAPACIRLCNTESWARRRVAARTK